MKHPEEAARFLNDSKRAKWHDETLWMVRENRDRAADQVPEWETLRELASGIKSHTLSRLDHYLEMFADNAQENGIQVHWASDANEHNKIVTQIIRDEQANHVVKSKSILTEECGLNHYLEKEGIEVIDTDLGERIIQFLRQPPSHIVMPAIHLKKEEISRVFHEKLHTEQGNNDPYYLTQAARHHLREKFLNTRVAITGVNFGIAQTGEFVVCTNEGNADMGVHLADTHIACMGIEKLIPEKQHLGVFLRLLARSATGQSITNYTSHFGRPEKGKKIHLILVDNGRTSQLARPLFRDSLKCIRCGACMNTCPIYRRSGGFSYNSTVPGPIGSILSPGLDLKKYSSLPFASTLCGSCSDVCPVKINIHEQLYAWRQEISKSEDSWIKKTGMHLYGWSMRHPLFFRLSGNILKWIQKHAPGLLRLSPMKKWLDHRNLPKPPGQTFQEWFKHNKKQDGSRER